MKVFGFAMLLSLSLAWGCSGSGGVLQSACSDAIKKRLKAPSTYRVLSVQPDDEVVMARDPEIIRAELSALPDNESLGGATSEAQLRLELAYAQRGEPYRAQILRRFVEYEAQNSMGVSLRSVAECTFKAGPDGKFSKSEIREVKIDGETYSEWLGSQLGG